MSRGDIYLYSSVPSSSSATPLRGGSGAAPLRQPEHRKRFPKILQNFPKKFCYNDPMFRASCRKEAQMLGLDRYYTGKPCILRGHICERYTPSGHCVECQREYKRRHYAKNGEELRAAQKRY